jgi:hypothetical protein
VELGFCGLTMLRKKGVPEGFLEWMELEGKGMICGWAHKLRFWHIRLLVDLFHIVDGILFWKVCVLVCQYWLALELRVDYKIGSKDLVMARNAVVSGGSYFISVLKLINNDRKQLIIIFFKAWWV